MRDHGAHVIVVGAPVSSPFTANTLIPWSRTGWAATSSCVDQRIGAAEGQRRRLRRRRHHPVGRLGGDVENHAPMRCPAGQAFGGQRSPSRPKDPADWSAQPIRSAPGPCRPAPGHQPWDSIEKGAARSVVRNRPGRKVSAIGGISRILERGDPGPGSAAGSRRRAPLMR